MIRILLIDDHAVVRAGYRRFLERSQLVTVVAEGENAEQGYAQFRQQAPDVSVIDLSMQGVGGLELIRRIMAHDPLARVLVFSMHEEAVFAERAQQAGARGYVTKQSAPDVLVEAVLAVHAGRRFVSPDMAKQLTLRKMDEHPVTALSAKEFEVFRLIALGQSVANVANTLNLSLKTVANHQTQVKEKLGASTTTALVHIAFRHGVIALSA
jgi:DNA-binding NarL/FixJ family response regulator